VDYIGSVLKHGITLPMPNPCSRPASRRGIHTREARRDAAGRHPAIVSGNNDGAGYGEPPTVPAVAESLYVAILVKRVADHGCVIVTAARTEIVVRQLACRIPSTNLAI
jgi:hypothetical protein